MNPRGYFGPLLIFDGIHVGDFPVASFSFVGFTTGAQIFCTRTRARYYYDKQCTAAVDGLFVVDVAGGGGRLLRIAGGDPHWQQQLAWYIDPDGTHGGDDENDGLTASTPIRSMREWRARIQGAYYTSSALIHALSGTSDLDYGDVSGFTTPTDSSIFVAVVGAATVLANGTGTLTGVTMRAGNSKGTITDSAQSWAAHGLVSSTSGVRMVRKTSGAWHAFIQQAVSTTEALITRPTNVSETPTATPANLLSAPQVGDAYEVCSLTSWPSLRAKPGGRVRGYLLDHGVGREQAFDLIISVLCGWSTGFAGELRAAGTTIYTSFFASTVSVNGPFVPNSCGFNGTVQVQLGATLNWNTLENQFLAPLAVRHGGVIGAAGTLVFFDLGSTAPVGADFASTLQLESVVGSGMTGKLITANRAVVYGAAGVTATTTDLAPFQLNGVSSATVPQVDSTAGGAIWA